LEDARSLAIRVVWVNIYSKSVVAVISKRQAPADYLENAITTTLCWFLKGANRCGDDFFASDISAQKRAFQVGKK